MFGYKAEDCIGRFFGEFVSDGEIEKAMSVFKNARDESEIRKTMPT